MMKDEPNERWCEMKFPLPSKIRKMSPRKGLFIRYEKPFPTQSCLIELLSEEAPTYWICNTFLHVHRVG